MFAVSACLLGRPCRYNGHSKASAELMDQLKGTPYQLFCPECDAGMPTPRPPAEIIGGNGDDVLDGCAKVRDAEGHDVTEHFIHGAQLTLNMCRQYGIDTVYSAEYSPSCGVKWIYDGTFTGKRIAGYGVTTALLQRHGIQVIGIY